MSMSWVPVRRSLLTMTVIAMTGCGLVQTQSAQEVATAACNRWESALDATNRDDHVEMMEQARGLARQASDMDEAYASLAAAFDQLLDATAGQDFSAFERASNRTFDECAEATNLEERLREEIDEWSERDNSTPLPVPLVLGQP